MIQSHHFYLSLLFPCLHQYHRPLCHHPSVLSTSSSNKISIAFLTCTPSTPFPLFLLSFSLPSLPLFLLSLFRSRLCLPMFLHPLLVLSPMCRLLTHAFIKLFLFLFLLIQCSSRCLPKERKYLLGKRKFARCFIS